jgi:hypothetical protein
MLELIADDSPPNGEPDEERERGWEEPFVKH